MFKSRIAAMLSEEFLRFAIEQLQSQIRDFEEDV